MLPKLGVVVGVDETFDVNADNFNMTTIIVMTDSGKITPAGMVLLYETDGDKLAVGLATLMTMVGSGWVPRVVMIDDSTLGGWIRFRSPVYCYYS